MKNIFIGPWLHWGVVIVLVALGWIGGLNRWHVSQFNPFILILIALTIAVLLLVLRTSPADRRVTRDPVTDVPPDDDQS